jgi:hypothetical protein
MSPMQDQRLLGILATFRRPEELTAPMGNLLVSPREAVTHLKMNLRAARDAWLGRMGRTLEPDADGSTVTRGRSV